MNTEKIPGIPIDNCLDTEKGIYISESDEYDELLFESLSEQVNEILATSEESNNTKPKKRYKKALKITGIVFLSLFVCALLLLCTKSGRKLLYKIASIYIYDNVDSVAIIDNDMITDTNNDDGYIPYSVDDSNVNVEKNNDVKYEYRREEYVTNYLFIGLEEFDGAKNTDSIILVSLNKKDRSIKLTSILRDIYIESLGTKKLNAFYAEGGADHLVNTIENIFKIQIDGYASVNFESFEKIIDRLDGITIELGKEEAEYLNTTNYISNPIYRNVKPGINKLNGNQALGYCRIRKVKTLGGANDDYGRTLRQRRVLKAVFDKYKSQNIFTLLSITKDCLGYVKTNVDQNQIENILETIVEYKITTMDNFRIPVDGLFQAPKKYNGVKYPLVLDLDKNIIELYKFIYLDTDEEAEEALKLYK